MALEWVVHHHAALTGIADTAVEVALAVLAHDDAGHESAVDQFWCLGRVIGEAVLCAKDLKVVAFVGGRLINEGGDTVHVDRLALCILIEVAVVRDAADLAGRQKVGLVDAAPCIAKEGVVDRLCRVDDGGTEVV